VPEHEVVVHGLSDDAGDGGGLEFEEGVMAGGTGTFVSGEAQAGYGAELGEVLAHLVFIEPVGDAAVLRVGYYVHGKKGDLGGKGVKVTYPT